MLTAKLQGWRPNQSLLSVIISTVVLLLAFVAAWGDLHAQIINIDHRVALLELAVKGHDEDIGRHVDPIWKAEITSRLSEIQRLITQHLADSIPKGK